MKLVYLDLRPAYRELESCYVGVFACGVGQFFVEVPLAAGFLLGLAAYLLGRAQGLAAVLNSPRVPMPPEDPQSPPAPPAEP